MIKETTPRIDKSSANIAVSGGRFRRLVLAGLIASVTSTTALATDSGFKLTVDYDRACGEIAGQALHRLAKSGDRAEAEVKARSYWNASGLIFEKGITYRIEVTDRKSVWKDASKEATAEGWWPDHVPDHEDWWPRLTSTLLRLFVEIAQPLIRDPNQNLFYLMGAMYGKCESGRICARIFPIGLGADFTAPADGEFCSFANDLPFMYGNNEGSIKVYVTRK